MTTSLKLRSKVIWENFKFQTEYEVTEVPDDDQDEWEYVDEKKEAAKMQKEKEKQSLKPERKVQKKAEIEPQPAEEHEYEETEQEQQSETNQEEKMTKKSAFLFDTKYFHFEFYLFQQFNLICKFYEGFSFHRWTFPITLSLPQLTWTRKINFKC